VARGRHVPLEGRQPDLGGHNTVEDQQMGIGEYRSDSPGLEVVLLDRIGPRDATGHDANVLLSSTDKLLWKETRTDYGWITVTENMNNWLGDGTDLILSYHRGGQTLPPCMTAMTRWSPHFPIVATWSTTFSTPIFAATARKKSSCTTKAESGFSPMATAIWMSTERSHSAAVPRVQLQRILGMDHS